MTITARNASFSPVMTNVGLAYLNDLDSFIASKVATPVKVVTSKGYYPTWTKSDWFRREMRPTASGAPAPQAGISVDFTGYYSTIERKIALPLPDKVRQEGGYSGLSIQETYSQWLAHQAAIEHELIFAANCMTTGVWSTDLAGGGGFTKWTAGAGDPFTVIDTALRTVQNRTGLSRKKLSLVMGDIVFSVLINHPDVVDRVKYVTTATMSNITEQTLAACFNCREVIVGRAIYNTAAEGATASYSPIIDDDLLVCHIPDGPGRAQYPNYAAMNASVAFDKMRWSPASCRSFYVSDALYSVMTGRNGDPSAEADIMWGKIDLDVKVQAADTGYFLSDCTD